MKITSLLSPFPLPCSYRCCEGLGAAYGCWLRACLGGVCRSVVGDCQRAAVRELRLVGAARLAVLSLLCVEELTPEALPSHSTPFPNSKLITSESRTKPWHQRVGAGSGAHRRSTMSLEDQALTAAASLAARDPWIFLLSKCSTPP